MAEAEVMKAKADSGMREAEAVKAKGLAEAESQKAKAEALAAYDGVAQRVEIIKLQLDAQVRIEIAKSQALGTALSSMNIKLIGDPQSASSLLRMVTLADGIGEVVKAAPQPVREIGQQLINKVTGGDGDSLTRFGEVVAKGQASDLTDLALLVPEIIKLTEKTLDVNKLKGQSVGQVLATLSQRVSAADKPTVEKAQKAVALLPIINDLPFEDMYLRATAK